MNEHETEVPGMLETDLVEVRTLSMSDLDWVVRIDAEHSGRRRHKYYEQKLKEAGKDTGIRVSLAARVGREAAGFLMARLYYGEFGQPEPVAILDSIGVARRFSGKNVGAALIRQLLMNLSALGIEKVQTQVDWNHFELLHFLSKAGFQPCARLCLERSVASPES